MELVIDANIVISALISKEGKTRELIFLKEFTLFAPEFLFEEIKKYKKLIIEKSKLDEESIDLALSLIFSKIKLIPLSEFEESLTKAKDICPDPNDEEYFALALSKNIPIWSNDKKLKEQDKIKICNTSELLEM